MATDWLLIDGSSLMFRAFYGIPVTVRSPGGEPVNAVRGFLDMLGRLVTDRNPRHLVVATDEDWRPAFRVDILPSYKAHRVERPIPEELEPQVSIILEVLRAIGIEVAGAAGFEAEDVIASLLTQIKGKAEIVTGDRDLFALVRDPDVCVLYSQQGIGRLVVVDEAEIQRRYGIPGRSYGDFAVLRGDPSDGLPGVPGIGPKSAAGLLRRYGDLDGVIRNAALGPAAVDYLDRARRVVQLVTTIPLPPLQASRPQKPADPARLQKLNETYGLSASTVRLLRSLKSGHASPSVSLEIP
jgi:5'-3' exonuclease